MAATVTASLDVMGGDRGAEVVVPGADIVLSRHPGVRFRLFGQESVVRPWLERYPRVRDASTFDHCEVAVQMDEKPSQALRHGRWRSSMWRAIDAVKSGDADFAVSAGNTGALMAMSKFCLRGATEVDRPAIAGVWPTMIGECVVLDCGATIGADADLLVAFAVMGAAMARGVLGIDRPKVGLLNVGVEEVKGLEQIRLAGQILREANLPNLAYVGFLEGDDISKGTVDVVVTEGFAGNIALKTAEGTAKQVASYIRAAANSSLLARAGFFLARKAFAELRAKIDTRRLNGGVFLGLGGIVIKSHGAADEEGFASAIEVGYEIATSGLLERINQDLAAYRREQVASENGQIAETGAM
jgi:glycerol-3-phosphate acyltransferase PlsX